ncbi:hypothetical protein [Embleya sp. NPDC005575]|uniref:hypothetical protein n=1 Tax=Embleya sp. NPDC005575 TaxID=3156892 RepID=UPI0033AB4FBC
MESFESFQDERVQVGVEGAVDRLNRKVRRLLCNQFEAAVHRAVFFIGSSRGLLGHDGPGR